ncbi:MAG TPA: nucleotidyltransferase family protein [Chthonomonadaceae bacterium]|nr:nucleotidyltransferase family protein [Chthonomonadaceae bacterium]
MTTIAAKAHPPHHPFTPSPHHPLTTAAIILAAGQSRRMGRLKMLLPFGDRPMLARVIESLAVCSAVGPILVVTGHAAEEIRDAVGEYDAVRWVHNPDHAAGGMLSSVKAGVAALPEGCPAFFLALGDQPLVRSATLDALANRWDAESRPIAIPTYEGRRGHPVLISARFAGEILALGETETLKTLINRHEDLISESVVDDPGAVSDVDTPDEYERALALWREMSGPRNGSS